MNYTLFSSQATTSTQDLFLHYERIATESISTPASVALTPCRSGVDQEVILSWTLVSPCRRTVSSLQLLHISNISSSIKLEGCLVIKMPTHE